MGSGGPLDLVAVFRSTTVGACWRASAASTPQKAAILLRGLSTGRFEDAVKGLIDAVRGLGPVWEDRRTVQTLRTASLSQLPRAMVWNAMRMLGRSIAVEPLNRPGLKGG